MKICPNCGKPPIQEGLIQCHTCKVPFIEKSEIGLVLSKDDLDQISKNVITSKRFWIQLSLAIGILIVFGGVPAVTVISLHYANKSLQKSLYEFDERASNRLAAAYLDVTNRISIALQDYEQKADAQLAAAHEDMTNRIANEFEEPRIKEIVAQVAAMQASNLLNQQISPEIENFRTGTSNTLAQFDNSLQTFRKESTNALADVRTATEFALIVSKAQNDDAVAFNQLQQIANSGSSSFAQSANDIARTIIQEVETYARTMEPDTIVSFDWHTAGIDPSKASLQQLKDFYSSNSFDMQGRFNAVKQVFNNTRFPEQERFDYVALILQTDKSLRVRELCCDLMDTKANSHLNFTQMSSYLQWLMQNRSSLTNSSTTVTK
jgi:hypothetical protein